MGTQFKYTGKAVKPKVTLVNESVLKKGKKVDKKIKVKAKKGRDYSVSYQSNKSKGIGVVKIIGKGNYTGYATYSFMIGENTKKQVIVVNKSVPTPVYIQSSGSSSSGNTSTGSSSSSTAPTVTKAVKTSTSSKKPTANHTVSFS